VESAEHDAAEERVIQHEPEGAELLGHHREGEVGLARRWQRCDRRRQTLPAPASGRDRPEPFAELVAVRQPVRPRRLPHHEARLHRASTRDAWPQREHDQRESHDRERGHDPARRARDDREHAEEHEREQQDRAQVADDLQTEHDPDERDERRHEQLEARPA